MSAPGFLAVGGVELANNARTVAYLAAGLGGSEFQIEQAGVCTDLLEEAWPLEVCTAIVSDDQLYADPRAAYRIPSTGAVPSVAQLVWREAGYMALVGSGLAAGAVLPNLGVTTQRVRLTLDVLAPGAPNRVLAVGSVVGVGTANYGWVGIGLRWQASSWFLSVQGRIPGGTTWTGSGVNLGAALGQFWLDVVVTPSGVTGRLYGSDPAVAGAPLVASVAYGYSGDAAGGSPTPGAWFAATGQTELQSLGTSTEVGVFSTVDPFPLITEAVISGVSQNPDPSCVSVGNLYPSETLYPSGDLYPGLYGAFIDPAIDGAPWADAERPESFGFLGLIIDDIIGLDTTSTRTMSDAADGIGGILGPTQLEPRDLEVRGWFIADGDQAMEYGRRWFAEVLGGSLCEGCGSDYVDLRSTCSGDADTGFYTNRWRLYDVGVTSFAADTSDPATCGRVTPVVFKLAAANPYLYGPELEQVPATLLNPDGPDAPPVPFESWLFNDETAICTTLADEQVGEQAPIFSFYGGAAGIEAGLAYVLDPLYPGYGLYPSDDLYPGEDVESGGGVPFVFSFAVGPGERFVIDAAQRRVVRTLADGVTQVDGSASLYMGPGDVITWPDTCAGDVAVCARAYAACTCDETASVTITSMHRER